MELSAKEEKGKVEIEAKGISLPAANAIRRYAMSRVPVLAIEGITMYDNTSSVFDEYIAHRMGLLPIKTPKGLPESVEVTFTLDAVGPKKIMSGDLKSNDAAIGVAEPNIPIITLFEGQNLRLEGRAVLDNGRTHAKHQAGLAVCVPGEDGSVSIKAESFLSMGPSEMLVRACNLLEKDLKQLAKEAGKLEKGPAKKKASKKKAKKAAKK